MTGKCILSGILQTARHLESETATNPFIGKCYFRKNCIDRNFALFEKLAAFTC